MSVSNKTLAVMLLAAIVVSLGGTFISLNRLGTAGSPTGHAINPQGNVSLDINSSLSITTIDNHEIDFGMCVLGPDSAGITINSNRTESTANCANGGTVNPIIVRNNGNINAIITVQSAKVGTSQGGTFLNTGSTNSSLQYRVTNTSRHVTYEGGCISGLGSSAYATFATAGAEYGICNNLQSHGVRNSVEVDFQIVIPTAAARGDNVTITFSAAEAI